MAKTCQRFRFRASNSTQYGTQDSNNIVWCGVDESRGGEEVISPKIRELGYDEFGVEIHQRKFQRKLAAGRAGVSPLKMGPKVLSNIDIAAPGKRFWKFIMIKQWNVNVETLHNKLKFLLKMHQIYSRIWLCLFCLGVCIKWQSWALLLLMAITKSLSLIRNSSGSSMSMRLALWWKAANATVEDELKWHFSLAIYRIYLS